MRSYHHLYFMLHAEEDDVVPDELTEIRVHGVSGAPPEQLLGDPHPLIVTGDGPAAFYRRTTPTIDPPRTVEAYSWSGLNSRAASRAFWLLLFPFAMANFAGWTVPADPDWKRLWTRALIRLLGILFTIHYALWAMVIAVDLLAVQCGESDCRNLGWLGWFRTVDGWLAGDVVRRMSVLGAVPVLLILLFLLLGRRTKQRYDDYWAGDVVDAPEGVRVDDLSLRHAAFWRTASFIDTQALFNVCVTLSVIAAVFAWTVAEDVLAPDATLRDLSSFLGNPVSARKVVLFLAAALCVPALLSVYGSLRMGATCKAVGASDNRPYTVWRRLALTSLAITVVLSLALVWLLCRSSELADESSSLALSNLRRSFQYVLLGELGLVLLLGILVYLRLAFASVILGWILYASLTWNGTLAGHTATWRWALLIVVVAGSLMQLVYKGRYWRSRSVRGPRHEAPRAGQDLQASRHLHNPFYIFVGLAVVTLVTIVGVRAGDAGFWSRLVLLAAPVAYLLMAFHMQIRNGHDYPPSWHLRGGAASVVAAVGAIVLTLVSVATIVLFAQRLDPPDPTQPKSEEPTLTLDEGVEESRIVYYEEFGWLAAAGAATLIVFASSLAVRIISLWYFRWRHQVKSIWNKYKQAAQNKPPNTYDGSDMDFAKKAAWARLWGALVDDGDWLLSVAVVAFLSSAISLTVQLIKGDPPTGLVKWLIDFSPEILATLASGAVFLVLKTRTDAGLRRAVGILWEVTSFFPRRFHPLSPPCYAERSVPELRFRLACLTDDGRVLLVAHSQGTLICTAALLTFLDDSNSESRMERIAWVTFGCMLRRLFGRGYPSVVCKEDLVDVKTALEKSSSPRSNAAGDFPEPHKTPRWMNFGRYSDYLGGRVFCDLQTPPPWTTPDRHDDIFFDDPTRSWRYQGQPEHARMWRHSFDYSDDDEDPRFSQHIRRIANKLKTELNSGTRS